MLPISEAMRAALTAPTVEVDYGVDLLDAEDRVVGDLSADVTALSVEHTLRADVHRTCTLSLTRDLVWGVDRVRPWLSVWDGHSFDVETVVKRGPVQRTNLCTNPSGEGGVTGWATGSASTTVTTSYPQMAGQVGARIFEARATEATSAYMATETTAPAPVAVGQWFAVRAWAAQDSGADFARRIRLQFRWVDATGNTLGWSSNVWTSAGFYAGKHLVHAAQAPAGATGVRFMVQSFSGSTATMLPIGHRHWFDQVVAATAPTQAEAEAAVATYFDGDTPATATTEFAWSSTPHASTSTMRPILDRHEIRTPQVHKWPLGVFLLTTPEQVAGESPRIPPVTGMDKLWLLQREVGDTYVVPAGTSYLDAIRGVLTDAGVTGGLLLQGDRQDTTLTEPAVWPLLENGYTWLDVANGLLGMIAYQGLWVDEMGRFRSAPVVDPHTVGTAWTFDTTDVLAGVVGEDRTLSADVWGLPNHWRFVRNKDRALTADDTYVVDRTDGLLPQQVRRRTVYLDVADRAALVAEGDRIVAEDTATEKIATLSVSPLPFEHGDVVQLRDPDLGLYARGVVRRWSIDHEGNADVDVEVVG